MVRVPRTDAERFTRALADQTRAVREAKQLTVTELAAACGCTPAFISQIETGIKRTVTIQTALMLARGLGMELVFHLEPRKRKLRKAA